MLVLSRQVDESIMIGDDVEVMVVRIGGDKVLIGIDAPKELRVHRKEIYTAIQRENANAAAVKVGGHGATGGEIDVLAKSRGTAAAALAKKL